MRIVFSLIFCISLLFSQNIHPIWQDGDILDDFDIEVYEDVTAQLSLQEIQYIDKFTLGSNKISEGYTRSNFWYRFSIKNMTQSKLTYYIQFLESTSNKIDCYISSVDGAYVKYRAGMGYYSEAEGNKHIKPKFDITLNSNELKSIYISISSRFPLLNSFKLLNKTSQDRYSHIYEVSYAFYFGSVIALIFYNLFLYLSIRGIVYLYYIIYIILFLLWQLHFNGYYPFDTFCSGSSYYRFGALIIPLLVSSFIFFSRSMLDVKQYFPQIDRVLKYFSFLFISLAFSATIYLQYSFIILNTLSNILTIYMLYLAFIIYKSGNKIALFYIIAQSIFLSSASLFSLMTSGYLEYSVTVRHTLIVGSYMEIILLSMALGYKVKLLQNEKLDIVTKSNLELEGRIRVRTLELRGMLDRAMEAIGIYENYILVETNSAAINIFRYKDKDSMLGRNTMRFIAPSSRRLVAKKMRAVYTEPYEYMALREDGSEFPVLARGSHYQIEGRVVGVVAILDLTSIKEHEKQLILAKHKAEQATKAKSDFLANMSHEIRTPINGIMGMTHLALQTELSKKQRYYLDTIISSSSLLSNIINDILDFSKIEAGKLHIDRVDFDLYKLVENIRNSIQYSTKEKDLEFTIEYDNCKDYILYGDSLRLSQILLNLINNAIKFTASGYVKVSIKQVGKIYTFVVEDSGIGMNQEQKSTLFQAFSQADSSTTREYGGTGLGLVISKQLVELMSGEIWCDTTLGEGSRFSFSIKLSKGKIENIIDKELNITDKTDIFRDRKILLVEDNIVNQEIILGLLEESGVEIDIANNGKEAISKFDTNKYELILMDLQLPIMSGIEASKIIRDKDKNIPIIALTANAMKEDIERTKKVGINEHLSKPIDISRLYAILIKYIIKESDTVSPISPIDIQAGLQYFAGNRKLYFKILHNFYTTYKNIKLDPLNTDEIQRLIHTIKGLSANIGALELADISRELDQRYDTEKLDLFYDKLSSVLDEIDRIVVKDIKIVVSDINSTKQSSDILFAELKKAVMSKQIKKCQPIIAKLKSSNLSDDDYQIFMEIKSLVEEYRFKDAIILMDSIK